MGKVSCIIPAYNEEKTIVKTIRTALDTPEIGEVIVVNDGSTDNTKIDVKKIKNSKLRIINLKQNRGKGHAVIQGVKVSRYLNLLFLDADIINLRPYHLSSLIRPVLKDEVDMSIGPQVSLKRPRWMIGTLPFCGQRCLKKSIIKPHIKKLEKTKYGLETVLNHIFNNKRTIIIPLFGNDLKHIEKHQKDNEWLKNYTKEIWQITQSSIRTKSQSTQQRIKEQVLSSLSNYLKVNLTKLKEYIQET